MLLHADRRVGNLEGVSFLWMQADEMPPQKFFRFPATSPDVASVVKPLLA